MKDMEMKDMEITGRTGLLCLLGSPVGHSISPQMHNEACRIVGEDLRYLAFDVNEEGLETAVKGLVTLGVRGFNLTMPVKNAMAGLCDELSPAARIGGAVNTVVNDNGRLIGHTTDGVGFVMSAKAEGVDIAGRRIVQLGAGGAGTAILVQMAMDGAACIDVFNMKDAFWPRVESIVSQLNLETGCHVSLHDLSDMTALKDCMKDATMLVNTTPVGMTRIPGCLIPDASYFNREMVVADVIYEPKETELLRMAREAGLKTFNGLYMLLYQGAAAFRLWTGKDMPVDVIKEKYFSGR
jgi:shikimate dehydrogenase